MRLRIVAGCLLGAVAVALAGPPTWLPWAGWVRAQLPAWWMLPLIASALLAAAAVCLPGDPGPEEPRARRWWPTTHSAGAVALGLGLLLLLEPVLHLGVLAYLARLPAPGSDEVLLPGAVGLGPDQLALRIAVLCVAAPVAEELFFRGRLLPWLALRIGPWPALSFTSLAFALAHGSPIACLVAAPIGLLLGWLRLQRRDLGACVLVHQTHNGLFLLAGPALVTAPVSAAVLAVGGALMLILAALHERLGWRAIPVGLALAAALALAVPPVLAIKDRWWADGVARLVERPRSQPGAAVARLDAQRRRGRLTEARALLLRERLAAAQSPAARAVRLWLDGADARSGGPDDALRDLRAASQVGEPPPALGAGAAAIGAAWPTALAVVALEDPALVAEWLGPSGALQAIAGAEGRTRRLLLAALERAWPGRLATVLLALPAASVTPIDRRHLRLHYPDADAMIRALDPARRAAWEQTPR
jgi:membrane protease YdiL (CAAX protease family)